MKELDLLLTGYLDSRYSDTSETEQGAFRALLDLQDPELYAYVLGQKQPADEEQRRVIDALRRTP
ncbi:MAG: succinate dehydrogenase assembly factor 2 [Bacillota bacterium]